MVTFILILLQQRVTHLPDITAFLAKSLQVHLGSKLQTHICYVSLSCTTGTVSFKGDVFKLLLLLCDIHTLENTLHLLLNAITERAKNGRMETPSNVHSVRQTQWDGAWRSRQWRRVVAERKCELEQIKINRRTVSWPTQLSAEYMAGRTSELTYA